MKRLKPIKAKYVIAAMFLALIFLFGLGSLRTGGAMLYHMVTDRSQIETLLGEFEGNLNASFPKKNAFVDLNGLFHRMLLQREMNGVVLLKNGSESELMSDRSAGDIRENAESLKRFSDWLGEREIDMFFCLVPMKNVAGDGQLPTGLVDHSNEVADAFLGDLSGLGVNFLDLREGMRKDFEDPYSLYLRTEHHWNAYGGFYGFTKLCAYMQEHFGTQIDPKTTDLNNYHQDLFSDASLGYYGQRTGFLFAGFDDFTLVYPKFETRQSCTIPHKEIVRSGSFYDAVFDMDKFTAGWRDRGLYGSYIGGDYPLVIHHSDTAENDGTVMLFIDSYGTIPEAYLTTAFRNVIAVDLRWVSLTNMGKTAAQFIEEYAPDTVIVMFNPNQLGSAGSDQFNYGID